MCARRVIQDGQGRPLWWGERAAESPADLWKWRGRAFTQGTALVNTEAGSCFIPSAPQTLRSPAWLEQSTWRSSCLRWVGGGRNHAGLTGLIKDSGFYSKWFWTESCHGLDGNYCMVMQEMWVRPIYILSCTANHSLFLNRSCLFVICIMQTVTFGIVNIHLLYF